MITTRSLSHKLRRSREPELIESPPFSDTSSLPQHSIETCEASRLVEISKLEQELIESSDKLHAASKLNKQLKKDLQQQKEQGVSQTEVPDSYKTLLLEKEQLLAKRQEDNKRLQDHNDELLAQIEEMRQAQQVAKKALAPR
ncbi:hypothetical protein ElyMa_002198000 [Elysia marginata]|uniref:cGMP-dependent protein kinase interacting domain-containing protein n=1 Tax=Elysia marginata TaxID=1093978 RepID=A0AAV4FSM5_9GAST|nr:hypothetical protein ElyMa_002198000 [Elysia marginata]